MDNLTDLLEPTPNAKSYTQLLEEGVQHRGGLALLASEEKMADQPPSTAALRTPSVPNTSI